MARHLRHTWSRKHCLMHCRGSTEVQGGWLLISGAAPALRALVSERTRYVGVDLPPPRHAALRRFWPAAALAFCRRTL